MKSESKSIKIERLQSEDLDELIHAFSFPWTTIEVTTAKWKMYLAEHLAGERIVCIAIRKDRFVGYGSLLKNSKYQNFRSNGILEIHDVWIAEDDATTFLM